MKVHAYASRQHYADHLLPIWRALPDELRGESWSLYRNEPWGKVRSNPARNSARSNRDVILVASYQDLTRWPRQPVVYVEHGAGQSYLAVPTSGAQLGYPGGLHPPNVIGYVCPSERVASAWRQARPDVAVCVAGCPRLDPWLSGARGAPEARTVAFTWHWDARTVCPEARSALRWYRADLARVASVWRGQGFTVLGHGHPRHWTKMKALWDEVGVEAVESSETVLDRSGVVVGDNSSLLFEAAALGRAVVCLNAPWYRRDLHHGLRFWDLVPGVQIDGPDELAAFDLAGYADDPATIAHGLRVGREVYTHTDGRAAERAARWLTSLVAPSYNQSDGHETADRPAGAADHAASLAADS